MSGKFTIDKPHYLIVEGDDDKSFFDAFLEHHRLEHQIGVYTLNQSYSALGKAAATLKELDVQKRIISLVLIRDADDSVEGSFMDVCNLLAAENLEKPLKPHLPAGENPRIFILIIPPNQNGRMLEDLLFNSIVDTPAGQCILQYFECLKNANIPLDEIKLPKIKANAFRSTFYNRVEKKPPLNQVWNFDSPVFDSIKAFLQQLAAPTPPG